jgi:type I protein arginine methyltransferase
VYSLLGYRRMVADGVRMAAYARALRAAVRPGATVLDIGTGTGAMAVLACRFGAGRVIAVEPDSSIEVARLVAAQNGVADRIEFLRQTSQELTLDGGADVIVADLRGVLPWRGEHIASIADARDRHLSPGGVLIPQRDTLHAAAVHAPAEYASHAPVRLEDGVDMSAVSRFTTNLWQRASLPADALLTKSVQWSVLDYGTVTDSSVHERFRLEVTRAGTAHGLAVWFDADLGGGATFSNSPGESGLIYGQGFFPWAEPVALCVGDEIAVELRADLVGHDYVWTWNTDVLGNGDAAGRRARFRQSTFLATPHSTARLARGTEYHVTALGREGRIRRAVLGAMDGRTSVGDIASALVRQHPDLFPDRSAALERVAELSREFGAGE